MVEVTGGGVQGFYGLAPVAVAVHCFLPPASNKVEGLNTRPSQSELRIMDPAKAQLPES